MRNNFLFLIFFVPFILFFSAPSAADEDLDSLFKLPEDTLKTDGLTSPFKAEVKLEGDTAIFIIRAEPLCYIYKDSLTLDTPKGTKAKLAAPRGTLHQDFSGQSEVYFDTVTVPVQIISSNAGDSITLSYRGCDSKGICYPPQEAILSLPQIKSSLSTFDLAEDNAEDSITQQGLLLTLVFSFLLGIGLDLTPCVLPMLSIYSAMLLGGQKKDLVSSVKLNGGYLAGLTLTYTLIGLCFARVGLAAHAFLQHPLVIIIMVLFLLYFAADCAGFINMKLPKRLNAAIEASLSGRRKGYLGFAILFGALSGLLATPCTSAPLAGALLYVMHSGQLLNGTLMFMSIGLGMGTPLVIAGIFGTNLLPKPGPFSLLIRRLMAIPLLFAAWYISAFLYEKYDLYVQSLLVALITGYLVFAILSYKRPTGRFGVSVCVLLGMVFGTLALATLPKTQPLPEVTRLYSLAELEEYKGEPLLVTFSAKWCQNCHALDSEVYANEDFLKKKGSLAVVRFDLTDPKNKENLEIAACFNLVGVPQALLLDRNGHIVDKVTGYTSIERFFKLLDKASSL